jgi:hypothetical protein
MLSDAQVRRFIEDGFVRIDAHSHARLRTRAGRGFGRRSAVIPMILRPGPVQSFASAPLTTSTERSRFRSARPPTRPHSMTPSTGWLGGGVGTAVAI